MGEKRNFVALGRSPSELNIEAKGIGDVVGGVKQSTCTARASLCVSASNVLPHLHVGSTKACL